MARKKTVTPEQALRKDLERMVWSSKHRDYKSTIAGRRFVMIYRAGLGSCLESLDSISNADLITMLPSSLQRDYKR